MAVFSFKNDEKKCTMLQAYWNKVCKLDCTDTIGQAELQANENKTLASFHHEPSPCDHVV